MKQKPRIQWLQLGDSNTAFVFASMKNRFAQNVVRSLTSSSGEVLQTEGDIAQEITGIYKDLLGSAVAHLPSINPEVMKLGPTLDRHQ